MPVQADQGQTVWRAEKPVRPPIAWLGGKFYMANWIIEQLPEHRVYIEPFGGMANVMLKKVPSEIEIYNDLDNRLVNFFRVIRNRNSFSEFQRLCELTPYSREEFTEVVESSEPTDPLENAHWFFVRCRQARGGLGSKAMKPNAWATSNRTRRGMPEPVSKYLSAIDGLPAVADRFRQTVVEKMPAIELVKKYDGPGVVFYCDPPYPRSTLSQQTTPLYGIDMSDQDHLDFIAQLNQCQAKVLISSYDSPLYSDALSEWHRIERPTHVQFSNSGQKRTEVLWSNYKMPSND